MKKLGILIMMAVMLTGCGLVYTNVQTPMPSLSVATTADSMEKVGRADCVSYFYMVGLGDCSVSAAMKNGGITKLHHIDGEFKSIVLGLYERYTIVAYGE